ncbi:MAG: tetratricopeptide repeat protein [Desulfobulbales bacterium]|nr:tetratricopeptide repeat protein [Desulfobulbales bacterium]
MIKCLPPEEANSNNCFYLLRIAGSLLLLIFCVSCAASSIESPTQSKVLTSFEEADQEEKAAANDMACAYFYFLWGKTAENNQRFEEALEAYEKALLCDEDSEYIKRKLAILFIKMDRKEQAARVLEQIISANPQDTENRTLLAKVYSSLNRNDDAVEIYQELLGIKEDHDTLLMLGTIYAKNGEYDKAQKILNRLIQLEGDSYLAHYYLARLYREMQYNDKAAASYAKALELNWFERLAFEVAEYYEERKEYTRAIKVYRRIIAEGESIEMAKTRLVNIYLTLEENDKALELLRDLRSVLPESHNVDMTISRILLSQEKYDEAIMILEDVLQTNPELTVVHYLLGMSYYQKENNQKAEDQLKYIPAESSLYEDSIFLRVKILSESDDHPGAIELLEEQINDAETRKPSFYILLASLYRENEQAGEGREVYEQAVRLYPDNVDLLYNYAIFLEKKGEQGEAMSTMLKVLDLDPDNGAALNYVGYTWADNDVHLESALELIKRAVELLPDDGYVRDSLGWVYYKLGNTEQAIIELEKASGMVENDPVIKEHLGDVYSETGQYDKALSAYEEAYKFYEDEEKKENVNAKINSLRSRGGK